MKILFLIPARGGSKGFPGKNAALLAGIPLVGRAARTAKIAAASHPGSRVVCSTDSVELAERAREWGAETPFMRPAHLATDEASSIDVVRHAIDATGGEFDAVVLLQPTSPLVSSDDIHGALAVFAQHGDPVISVCSAEHPVEWHYRLGRDGRLNAILPVPAEARRQATAPSVRPNGAVYVASPAHVRADGFWTSSTRAYVMPAERSIDIDHRSDLALAAAFARHSEHDAPTDFAIGDRRVGLQHPCFVIAEAGVNHNGQLDLALQLIDAAADAGADAVKFQTFRADALVTATAAKAAYQTQTTDPAESQRDMLRALELGAGDYAALQAHAKKRGITFLSTPFDEDSADLLADLGVQAFKLSSGDLTNLPLIAHVSRRGRPVILSTGMATLVEADHAVAAARGAGARDIAVLQCVSNYPADPADSNLRTMETMADAFGVVIGYSDHTVGNDVPLAAVARGAKIIEKHLTLDRTMTGPDHAASAEPHELGALIRSIRSVEAALGDGVKRPAASEADTARVARRSLTAIVDIPAGAAIEMHMLAMRRPGTGLPARRINDVLGRVTRAAIAAGTTLHEDMFA